MFTRRSLRNFSSIVSAKEALKDCPKQLFINNQWVDSVSGKTFTKIDPSTEEELCHVARGNAEDIDIAVRAANDAF
jgi:hypothetical protein